MVISINELDSHINNIENSKKEYELNVFETLSTVKNMQFYWSSGYTRSFFEKVDKEFQDVNAIIECINNFINVLESIEFKYSIIGNRISDSLGLSSEYINSDDLNLTNYEEEDKLIAKQQIYNAILGIESSIAELLSHINVPFIQNVDFSYLDKDDSDLSFLGMKDEMENEIRKLVNQLETIRVYRYLIDDLREVTGAYNSPNGHKIESIISNIEESLLSIDNNINNTYNYIVESKEELSDSIDDVAIDTRNILVDN